MVSNDQTQSYDCYDVQQHPSSNCAAYRAAYPAYSAIDEKKEVEVFLVELKDKYVITFLQISDQTD